MSISSREHKPFRCMCAYFLFFAVILLLRVYGLGKHDLWFDEIGTLGYADYPWSNWNAPLYWIFLHFWIKIFPVSEFFLRLPSALFSFGSVIILFFLGRLLFSRSVALLAALIMGLSPFHLWYAQEAREYSMILFLSLFSSYLFLKALKDGKAGSWIYFSIVSAAALYTNYFMIFLLFAQATYGVVSLRRWRVITWLLIPLAGFLLYFNRFISKFIYLQHGFWIPPPDWLSPFVTLGNFMLGYNVPSYAFYISVLAVILMLGILLKGYPGSEAGNRNSINVCLFLSVFPVGLVFIFSRLIFSVYLSRGLIIFSPYLYLLVAAGIFSLGRVQKRIAGFIVVSLLIGGVAGYFSDSMPMPLRYHLGVFLKKPVKPLIAFLDKNMKNGDAVAITNQSILPSFSFYYKGSDFPVFYFFDPVYPDTTWQRPFREDKINIPLESIKRLKYDRFWVLTLNWARDGNIDENSVSVNDWMSRNFVLDYSTSFEGVKVFRYIKQSDSAQ